MVDNINVDPVTGNLWLAGIPRPVEFVEYAKNLSHPSPSQIVTLQLGEPSTSGKAFLNYQLREVYMNNGKEIAGATSAIVHEDHLLIGSLFGNMLYCEVKFY